MKTITIDDVIYELTPIPKKEERVYTDWRLPTIKELFTLVDFSKSNPASFDKSMLSDLYWSSTTYEDDKKLAWYVYFHLGGVNGNSKSINGYVRCVRTGDNGLEWSATAPEKVTWDEAVKYAESLVAPVTFVSKNKD